MHFSGAWAPFPYKSAVSSQFQQRNLQAGFVAFEKAGGNTLLRERDEKEAFSHHAFLTSAPSRRIMAARGRVNLQDLSSPSCSQTRQLISVTLAGRLLHICVHVGLCRISVTTHYISWVRRSMRDEMPCFGEMDTPILSPAGTGCRYAASHTSLWFEACKCHHYSWH